MRGKFIIIGISIRNNVKIVLDFLANEGILEYGPHCMNFKAKLEPCSLSLKRNWMLLEFLLKFESNCFQFTFGILQEKKCITIIWGMQQSHLIMSDCFSNFSWDPEDEPGSLGPFCVNCQLCVGRNSSSALGNFTF